MMNIKNRCTFLVISDTHFAIYISSRVWLKLFHPNPCMIRIIADVLYVNLCQYLYLTFNYYTTDAHKAISIFSNFKIIN
ncbi:hypothetical protein JHK82_053634 [Glycine max]|uniref:Uncharacterized protein n=1 Tax=Glycine max TaxID=3847 RepID=K7MYF7_SOYBN|nr:hypothetical protein JHK86_053483 [Glycine max]KAG4915995.1 hypothetical protein JHK87_053552 [Glycine soja]KAG4927943.1 hypothetical protein JHK85_054429 [Glycine max]KAG5083466.1 hypothetical protein JHK84_053504 [Glycine max]KAG5086237.1 hypothetical protein JHK82_053634 [Glycine max]